MDFFNSTFFFTSLTIILMCKRIYVAKNIKKRIVIQTGLNSCYNNKENY